MVDWERLVRNGVSIAVKDWFRRACRNPFGHYYLYYKESPTGSDGPLFWTPIIDTEAPNEDWKIACEVSTAWTTDQAFSRCLEVFRKLPVLNIDIP